MEQGAVARTLFALEVFARFATPSTVILDHYKGVGVKTARGGDRPKPDTGSQLDSGLKHYKSLDTLYCAQDLFGGPYKDPSHDLTKDIGVGGSDLQTWIATATDYACSMAKLHAKLGTHPDIWVLL